MSYFVQRREVLAATTRVHYLAGPGRWMPDTYGADRYGYAEARKLSGEYNRGTKAARRYNVIFRIVPEQTA